DPAANTATIKSVNSFSNWTVGEPVAPTASNGIVTGRITGSDGLPVAGAVVKLNGTETRKTITDESGVYKFENVETNGFYVVTPSRADFAFAPNSRSFSLASQKVEAGFTGLSNGDTANPLDTPEFFVRQQYLDLLAREPDEGGFNYWSNRILECGGDLRCNNMRRPGIPAAFFIEREFQESGFFVYRLYRASFGGRPTFTQYLVDRNHVIGGSGLETARQELADDFVQRAAFKQLYPDSLSNSEFVNKLSDAAAISSTTLRQAEVDKLDSGATRSQVLQDLIEDSAFQNANYNAAFVTTEYFAYLRRNPEQAGLDFWLDVLMNREPGNYPGIVCSF